MVPGPASAAARRTILAATIASGALVAQQVAGKATRDAFFLSSFDIRALPWVMMVSAALATLSVFVYSRLMALRSPARIVTAAVGTSALLFLAEWGVSFRSPRLAALALYLHVAVFGPTLVSGFWSLVNERFDPHTARRVMARIGSGASLGGVAGGALAWGVAGLIPVPAMLPALALIHVVSWWGLRAMRGGGDVQPEPARSGEPTPSSGLRVLRQTPYLRDLALIVGLGATIEALLDYVLNAKAAAALPSGQALMSFFSVYHTGVGLLALLLQSTLTHTSLLSLGLGGTVSLKPAVVTACSLLGASAPRLASAVLARGLAAALNNSLFRSGYELLYTPLPGQQKRPAKALVDIGVDKLGTALGGALALVAVATADAAAPRVLFGLAALGSLAILWVCRRVHRGYVAALEASLRSGAVRLEAEDVLDSTTMLTLAQSGVALERSALLRQIEALHERAGEARPAPSHDEDPLLPAILALRSPDAATVHRALTDLADPDPALVPHIAPLLARNELSHQALRALRRAAPRATGAMIDVLLDLQQPPVVRRRIPRVLRACFTQRAVDGLLLGLADERFDVRYACGLALDRITERAPALNVPAQVVHAAVLRELAPAAAADAERRIEHVFNLLSLVLEKEPVRITYWAVTRQDPLRGTALEYLENVLPPRVREALWPALRAGRPASPAGRPRQELESELVRSVNPDTLRRDRSRRRRRAGGSEPGP